MKPDLKKISVTTWIALGGIFLYTVSLWQRPLFVSEFADGSFTALLPRGGCLPAARFLDDFLSACSVSTPLFFRLPTVLLTLFAAGVLFFAGKESTFKNASRSGALIFLLTPAVFLGSTAVSPLLRNGALLTAAVFALFALIESKNFISLAVSSFIALLTLTVSALLFSGNLILPGAFLLTAVYLVLRGMLFPSVALAGAKFCVFPPFLPGAKICFFLLFLPGAFLLRGADFATLFTLPSATAFREFAAFAIAGSFPWVLFWLPASKNTKERLTALLNEPFTLFAFTAVLVSLAGILFTTQTVTWAVLFVAGSAVLLGTALEMEYVENGNAAFNKLLWFLAVLFFIAAALIGTYSLLGLYTKMLKPAWKLLTAKDAWALTAVVPVVTGAWCLTAAGEKIHKERKFLAFCAGIAFALLAFHGLVPLKVIENNSPVRFFNQAVQKRLNRSTVIYCDQALLLPAKQVFRRSEIKLFSATPQETDELKRLAKSAQSACVLTTSSQISKKLPFPKTTLRSGRFFAVFYNIDLPEMRMRKP